MKSKKIVKLLEVPKANNGLMRERIEEICGKETDNVIAFIKSKKVCVWTKSGNIISVIKDKHASLIEELEENRGGEAIKLKG